MKNATEGVPDPGAAAPDGFVFELSGGHHALGALGHVGGASRPREGEGSAAATRGREGPRPRRGGHAQAGHLAARGDIRALRVLRARAGAKDRGRGAAATLKRAISLREAIYELFASFARGGAAPESALATLNAE